MIPRRMKKTKPLTYVFCEGKGEQAYTDFLKQKFSDVAVIKRPSATGLFEEADSRFKKDPKFRNSAEVTYENRAPVLCGRSCRICIQCSLYRISMIRRGFFPGALCRRPNTISGVRSKNPMSFFQLIPQRQCCKPINCCFIFRPQLGHTLLLFPISHPPYP